MNQNALQVSVITPAAAAQLALWDRISQIRPRPAVHFFSNPDILIRILPKYGISIRTTERTLLGFLNLFSACKGTRAWVQVLIDWVKPLFVSLSLERRLISPFCWRNMDGRPVGEYIMLFVNYAPRYERTCTVAGRCLHFPQTTPPLVTAVSRVPAVDLTSNHVPGFFVGLIFSWHHPLSDAARAFGDMFVRFQLCGDLSEFHKYGFFSSELNRFAFSHALNIIQSPLLRHIFVRCPYRLRLLRRAIEDSFGVVDLTPPLQGRAAEVEFRFLPQLSGLHVGVNPRDIAVLNVNSPRLGPGVTFDLVGAPLG
jgi:hypothetical protein